MRFAESWFCSYFRIKYYGNMSSTGFDIMHMLHLGINKHVFSTLITPLIISGDKVTKVGEELDRRLQAMAEHMPSSLGRFPTGISKHHSSFKAIQWKNAFCYFLPVCLRGLVPQDKYQCVLALSNVNLSYDRDPLTSMGLRQAQQQYIAFYQSYVRLCGTRNIPFNLHGFMHMPSIIKRLGHPRGFHMYGNERDIGFLQKFRFNGCGALEPQIAL